MEPTSGAADSTEPVTSSSSANTDVGASSLPVTASPRLLPTSSAASSQSPSHAYSSSIVTHSPQMERNRSGENGQWRSYWLSFIKKAGIDKEFAVHYASIFLENELDGSMLGDIDHSMLLSIGVKKAGHRIKLIRYAQMKLSNKKSSITPAIPASKPEKVNSRDKFVLEDKEKDRSGASSERKKRNLVTTTPSTSGSGKGSERRARANSKELLKRSDQVKAPPSSAPVPRRDIDREVSVLVSEPTPSDSASALTVKKEYELKSGDNNRPSHHPQQSEEEEDTESESTLTETTTDSDSDFDLDIDDEDGAVKAMRSRLKHDSSREKLTVSKGKSINKAESSSPAIPRAFSGKQDDDVLSSEFDEIDDFSQYHEVKFFFNLEPTKRYLESTSELTGRDFTEAVCRNLKCESGTLVVFTVQDNGEFVPLKEDDFINRSEIHYVIESRKVSKDIKKLKERLKKEKPVWDSDNWPLIVDFVDSKDIYMAEHGQIGLCMCPGRKKKKKRHVWARDLYKDLDRLHQVYNCDVLVTLVREQELRDLRIEDIFDEVKKRGMESLYLPIKDKWIPKSTPRLIDLVEKIITCLRQGKTVVVHCNGGKGRSATVIVACLIALGQSISHAIKILQRVRKGTIRNPLQQAYLRKFLSEWTAAQKAKQRKKNIIALTSSQQLDGYERDKFSESELLDYIEGGEGTNPSAAKDDTARDDDPLASPQRRPVEENSSNQPVESAETAVALSPPSAGGQSATGPTLAIFSDNGEDLASDYQPAPPSSEGEPDQRQDEVRPERVHWDGPPSEASEKGDRELAVSSGDHKRSGSISGDDGNTLSSSVPTIPHLTPLEKKLMKVRKLIKKTEKRIEKKQNMIAKERQHLDDLKVELKRVSAELKKEMSENREGRSGSFIERGRKSDKLAKSSSSRSPGPMRRKSDVDELKDKEDRKKERKEQKEKEREERRKEREERDRERKEKEREKREKGREERERREKEKEERKEKKKEEKLRKKETGKLSKSGSSVDLAAMLVPASDAVDASAMEEQLKSIQKAKEESKDSGYDAVVGSSAQQQTDAATSPPSPPSASGAIIEDDNAA